MHALIEYNMYRRGLDSIKNTLADFHMNDLLIRDIQNVLNDLEEACKIRATNSASLGDPFLAANVVSAIA